MAREDNLYIIELINKLSELKDIESCILQELRDQRDEGKAIYINGTTIASTLTVIDFVAGTKVNTGDLGGTPGHPVKGYAIKNNDSLNGIYVAHNISTQTQLDVDTIDATKSTPQFNLLAAGETDSANYNVQCITAIYIFPAASTPAYKLKVVW